MANEVQSVADAQMRLPAHLSLRDLITVVGVAISLAIAWNVYGTRITLLESTASTLTDAIARQEQAQEKMEARLRLRETQAVYTQAQLDRLFDIVGKVPPRPLAAPPLP